MTEPHDGHLDMICRAIEETGRYKHLLEKLNISEQAINAKCSSDRTWDVRIYEARETYIKNHPRCSNEEATMLAFVLCVGVSFLLVVWMAFTKRDMEYSGVVGVWMGFGASVFSYFYVRRKRDEPTKT